MKIPPSTIYITILILVGIVKQIPYHNLKYTLKHWFISPEKIQFDLDDFLFKTSVYYQILTSHDKDIFRRRVLKFIYLKRFIPAEGLPKVTNEMKVLIASKAIQLTFGFPNIYLTYLKDIYVYPKEYLSETNRYYKGETGVDGYLKLSWNNFLEGELNQKDGISLGLHEFTHALHIENHIQNDYYLFIKPRLLAELKYTYQDLKEEVIEYQTPIREYGVTNFHEFFAVTVEVFFEKPQELFDYNKDLYMLLTEILNQDMLEYMSHKEDSLHL